MAQPSNEYAEALFMLSVEKGSSDEYLTALDDVRALMQQNPDYIEFLASPAISISERLNALNEAFDVKMPDDIVSFLKVLCENGHIRLVIPCIDEYKKLVMSASAKVEAKVYSAAELSIEQKEKLLAKLEKLSNKTVQAEYHIDPDLISGIKIEFEGKTYDGSVKQHLREIKEVIIG